MCNKNIVLGFNHFGFKVVDLQRFLEKMQTIFGNTVRFVREPSGAVLVYLNEGTPLQVRQMKDDETLIDGQFKTAISVRNTLKFVDQLKAAGVVPDLHRLEWIGVIDFEIEGVPFHTVQVEE